MAAKITKVAGAFYVSLGLGLKAKSVRGAELTWSLWPVLRARLRDRWTACTPS